MALTYQWQRKKPADQGWSNITGATSREYVIGTSYTAALYDYRVIVSSTTTGLSTTSASATLTMKDNNVTISAHPQNRAGKDGDNVSFDVTAAVPYGTLSYQWEYSSDGGSNWSDSGLPTATTDSLVVTVSASADGRMYRCKVTADAGDGSGDTVTSNAATLTRWTAPVITQQPTNQSGYPTQNVTFSVTATE